MRVYSEPKSGSPKIGVEGVWWLPSHGQLPFQGSLDRGGGRYPCLADWGRPLSYSAFRDGDTHRNHSGNFEWRCQRGR